MVELLADFPAHVAAYRATGSVGKEEYRDVVISRVNEVALQFRHINFLVRLETNMDNYSIGAFLKYLKVSFQHFSKWNRMAIVSDERWVRKAYDTLSLLVPGEIRGYPLAQYEEAKAWVSGPVDH